MIVQLDTENADRDLTSQVTVLTHTPDAANPMICQGLVLFGDGAKDLDGTGGDFELTVTVGGQTIQPDPQVITFSTATRAAVWTTPFPVPANAAVLLKAKSPNAGDSDVDVTAYLYDVSAQGALIAEAVYIKMKYSVYGGAIWIDTVNGADGTEVGVNGIASNPVKTLADAVSLATLVGVRQYRLIAGSSITLASSHTGWEFHGGTVNLGGQDVAGAYFYSATITGTQGGGAAAIQAYQCIINAASGLLVNAWDCKLRGSIALAAGSSHFFNSASAGPATGYAPTFDLSAGACYVGMRNYSGKLTVDNLAAGDILSFDSPAGQLILNASCTGGEVRLRGLVDLVNNGSGVTQTVDGVTFDPTTGYVAGIAGTKNQLDDLNDIAAGEAMTLTGDYDAAKTAAQAGDAMTLTGDYDAAKTAAPTVEQIDTQLSTTHGAGAWGAGSGAKSQVYTVTVGGSPQAGVYCRLTTDAAGVNNVDAGTTNALGQVTFHHDLSSGTTVYVWRSLAGYAFDDPDVEAIP